MNWIKIIMVQCGFLSLLAIGASAFSLEPTGLAKPVADLRDYNGTYLGSPGTGTIGYEGTLYRDNQDDGATAGCRGEGCGRHPGVDIPVRSGTSVYNAIGGVVVISECNESWGGLVVVRATNPFNYGEQIYISYAHLKNRRYGNGQVVLPGDYVTTGSKIGESGGGLRDPCRGRTTGSHLHFQIDKDDGNPYPWYPHSSQLNKSDHDYMVTTKTYNPIVFLTGGYRWSFAQNGNRELWDLFNMQSWGVSGSALWVDSGSDPYIRRGALTPCGYSKLCSSKVSAEAQEYHFVYLDMYNHCSTGIGKVYFVTNVDPHWNEAKSVQFYSWYGSMQTHVWMSGHDKWYGVITGLRVDPAENCSPYYFDPTYYGEIALER